MLACPRNKIRTSLAASEIGVASMAVRRFSASPHFEFSESAKNVDGKMGRLRWVFRRDRPSYRTCLTPSPSCVTKMFCAERQKSPSFASVLLFVLACMVSFAGCGATQSFRATEQLLMSDAVDATVAQLDFRPMSGQKVYLDVTYLKTVKSPLLIDSDYVISSLRQRMVGAGVSLVETREEADLIAEARIGALGLDGHNVTYGLPSSNALSSASRVFTSSPIIPSMPEISLARHEAKSGAAKLAVFAYERETRAPYWQSGIARASSSARDTWVLGIGPWQRGTIYQGTRFAGQELNGTLAQNDGEEKKPIRESEEFARYVSPKRFAPEAPRKVPTEGKSEQLVENSSVVLASAIQDSQSE